MHQNSGKRSATKALRSHCPDFGRVQRSAVTAALTSHSVRADRAAASMEAYATISPVEPSGHSAGVTGKAAVAGIARTAVNAVIDVGIVVSLTIPNTEAPSIAKVMKISIIKAMVEMAEEKKRREAHVKR